MSTRGSVAWRAGNAHLHVVDMPMSGEPDWQDIETQARRLTVGFQAT